MLFEYIQDTEVLKGLNAREKELAIIICDYYLTLRNLDDEEIFRVLYDVLAKKGITKEEIDGLVGKCENLFLESYYESQREEVVYFSDVYFSGVEIMIPKEIRNLVIRQFNTQCNVVDDEKQNEKVWEVLEEIVYEYVYDKLKQRNYSEKRKIREFSKDYVLRIVERSQETEKEEKTVD